MKIQNIILIILVVSMLAITACSNNNKQNIEKNPTETIDEEVDLIGDDKDEHGCIGSAGYSWCENKQKCLRSWEEECEEIVSFRGTIIQIEDGLDGSSITLENEKGEKVITVISIPNLGIDSDFNFSTIQEGNILQVNGRTFEMNDNIHLTAKYAFTIFDAKAKEECENQGATYKPNGKLQFYACNLPAKDAGKECTSSTQCESLCLADGTCSIDTVNFGCIPILEDGNEVTICID